MSFEKVEPKKPQSLGKKGEMFRHVRGNPSNPGGYYHVTKGNRKFSKKRADAQSKMEDRHAHTGHDNAE